MTIQLTIMTVAGMLAAGATSLASLRDKPDVFFKPGPEAPKDAAADQLYPQGKLFPFSLPSPAEGMAAEQLAECQRLGIIVLPPQAPKASQGSLSHTKAEGPKISYAVGLARASGASDIIFNNTQELADEISAQVQAAASEPGIAFWHLKPGEIRHKDAWEKEYLITASKAIGRHDPLKRPVWIYLPPEASTASLSHVAPWVGYLGKALAADGVVMNSSRIWFRWAMERATEAIHETDAEATPVAVPVCPVAPSPDEVARFPTTVRHDLYLSLVTGAKGIISASPEPQPEASAREAYQNATMAVARDLLEPAPGPDLQKLGDLFLYGERRDELEVDIVDGPTEVEVLYPRGGVVKPMAYKTVSHLDLAYGKDRYLVLVNSAQEPVTLMVGGMPYAAVRAESLLDSQPPTDIAEGEFETDLQPLEVKIYRLTRR